MLTDAEIDNLWIKRDCIEAIQSGDILTQVRYVVREALAASKPEPQAQAGESETQSERAELIRKALHRAFSLGQTYWQQADSEYTSQHRKADGTRAEFKALVDETAALLAATTIKEGKV